jgi:hypothetical protein
MASSASVADARDHLVLDRLDGFMVWSGVETAKSRMGGVFDNGFVFINFDNADLFSLAGFQECSVLG